MMGNVVRQVKGEGPHHGHDDSTGSLLGTLWPDNYWNCLAIKGGAAGTEGAIVPAAQVEISAFRRSKGVEQQREGGRERIGASELIRERKNKVIGKCHCDSVIKSRHKMLLKTLAVELTSIHPIIPMHPSALMCTKGVSFFK